MGHELYRMILGGHPPEWEPPMLLVALVIADDARDPGQAEPGGDWGLSVIPMRGCWRTTTEGTKVWRPGLIEQTGMSERAISRALTKLGRAGFEMRVVVRTGKDGRAFFTTPGHALNFRVPWLLPREPSECPPGTAGNQPEHPPGTAGETPERPPDPPTEHPPDLAIHPPDPVLSPARYGAPISPVPPIPPKPSSHPLSPADVEGSRGRPKMIDDHDFSGDTSDGSRPALRRREAPPAVDPKTAGNLAYKIVRRLPREVGAELHSTVAAMLLDGTGEDRIRAALPAWHESGKPPEALPEFVEPPAEAATGP